MFKHIREDMAAVKQNDPAVKSKAEILFTYPGIYALWAHRIEHFLYRHKWYFLAKLLSQITRFFTGIEIHPGAQLGRGIFIDHGMGLVIGETAVVGNGVTLYHGVTLGGTGKLSGKRHPTIADNVLISAHVQVLGPITIGENSKIGASSVVLKDIPANATAVGLPAEIVKLNGERVNVKGSDTPHARKTRTDELVQLTREVEIMRQKVNEMRGDQIDDYSI